MCVYVRVSKFLLAVLEYVCLEEHDDLPFVCVCVCVCVYKFVYVYVYFDVLSCSVICMYVCMCIHRNVVYELMCTVSLKIHIYEQIQHACILIALPKMYLVMRRTTLTWFYIHTCMHAYIHIQFY